MRTARAFRKVGSRPGASGGAPPSTLPLLGVARYSLEYGVAMAAGGLVRPANPRNMIKVTR